MDVSGSQAGGEDASGDEAVWRDLIARYDMAVDLDTAAPPWPDIESLRTRPPGPPAPEQDQPGQQSDQEHPDQDQPDQDQQRRSQVPRDTGSSPASLGGATYTVGLPAAPPVGQDAVPAGSEPRAAPAGPEAGSGTGSSSGPVTDRYRNGTDRDPTGMYQLQGQREGRAPGQAPTGPGSSVMPPPPPRGPRLKTTTAMRTSITSRRHRRRCRTSIRWPRAPGPLCSADPRTCWWPLPQAGSCRAGQRSRP